MVLGELADKRLDAATALAEYQRFLSLWPKADQNLPDVITAKVRVSALGHSSMSRANDTHDRG